MYIGNTPAENYASFLTETFTVSATTNYTLSHAVTNENDIRLVINGVVQQPGSGKAYTASGTTLTLTSATVSGDVMYAVYLGRALQTVNPPNASVGLSQLSATGTKNSTTFLRGDNTFATAGGTNTPSFFAFKSGSQTANSNTATKLTFDDELWDVGGVYDNSTNYRFTPGFVGKSNISCGFWSYDAQELLYQQDVELYKNGSVFSSFQDRFLGSTATLQRKWINFNINVSHDADDYYEIYAKFRTTDNNTAAIISSSDDNAQPFNYFTAFKIIE